MQTLKFSTGNAKLKDRLIFSLPAGYSCPNAGVCKTFADRTNGTIMDLPQLNSQVPEFRCFAAMAEVRPNVRTARWHNWDLIREASNAGGDQANNIKQLIDTSLTVHKPAPLVRIHESGDFWHENYMKAWILTAIDRPQQTFYAYTKSLNMWLNLHELMPNNFKLTASYGGILDDMISKFPNVFTRYARVVYNQQEADDLELSIDHDDSHCLGDKPFALLVHGSQRSGSAASKAISERKKSGSFVGYGKTSAS